MNAMDVKTALRDDLLSHSRFEAQRKYLGMSRLGECPLRLYRECLNGRGHEANERAARRAARGYLFEGDMIARLTQAGVYRPDSMREVKADFDARLRGHTDGESVDGDLIEIKSCRSETFERVVQERRAVGAHYDQTQLYLRYGGYGHGMIVYVNTETYDDFVVDVWPSENTQGKLIAKARMVLAAIDNGEPPICTCGRCFIQGRAICQP